MGKINPEYNHTFNSSKLLKAKEEFEKFKLKTLSCQFSGSDWDDFNSWAKHYHKFFLENNGKSISEIESFREELKNIFTIDCIPGHIVHKPLGYAGDFQLIEKFYNRTLSKDIRFKIWDELIQNEPAANAVRNRNEYFNNLLVGKRYNNTFDILSLGCGSCCEIFEFLKQVNNPRRINFTCLDIEIKAIEFAKNRLANFDNICYVHINALRYQTTDRFDLIWSAGLFDYFNDKIFLKMIEKYFNLLKPSGELIIGNFSHENTTKYSMDIFGWHLNYRTQEHLLKLVASLELENCFATVDSENEGVNLFLKLNKQL